MITQLSTTILEMLLHLKTQLLNKQYNCHKNADVVGTNLFQSGMNLYLSGMNSLQFSWKIMAKYDIPWNNSTLATFLWKILSGSRTIYSLWILGIVYRHQNLRIPNQPWYDFIPKYHEFIPIWNEFVLDWNEFVPGQGCPYWLFYWKVTRLKSL